MTEPNVKQRYGIMEVLDSIGKYRRVSREVF
jgi:hypothetical protein